jgi:hypothetical protein
MKPARKPRVGLEEFLLGNWNTVDWGRPLRIWQSADGISEHQLSTPIGRLNLLCTRHLNE